MTATIEKHEFQTEAKQLLDLMIHSVYSHREIFLRELISNSSDAIDKRRVEALAESGIEAAAEPAIGIEADKEARTLTVSDNGIGMSREEVIRLIGTIAKSGSEAFLDKLKQSKDENLTAELIGQFGVGFYSTFMVADKVTLVTRRADETSATRWESTGDGTYTIEETEREEPGTTVTLHLKPADAEDSLDDFAEDWTIRRVVKKYSDFVTVPIRLTFERTEIERDEEGKPVEGAEEKTESVTETINSMKAIWTRPRAEVTDEEYNEFYKHIGHDWNDPASVISIKGEGTFEFSALLFIPSKAPMDMFYAEQQRRGIHLYVKRVFIMDDCEELVPPYLRFVRGVVDAEDLPLNISREILQKNRQIQIICKRLVKKILSTLETVRKDDDEKYLAFWGEFGRAFKEGIFLDAENKERVLELSLFDSTHSEDKPTTLEAYVARMQPGQDKIYYLTGETRELIKNSPHLEAFAAKGIEVLLLSDPVDEVWTQQPPEFEDRRFESIGKGVAQVGTDEEKKKAEEDLKDKNETYGALLEALKGHLDEHVKEVRLSTRLTESAACLVGDLHDITPQMEALMRSANQPIGPNKRILELNPDHPILENLQKIYSEDAADARLADYAELLHGQALLAEGGRPPEPAKFSRLVTELMMKAG